MRGTNKQRARIADATQTNVYLAHDEQLDRLVAIKVPHAKLISKPDDAEAYLTEAGTVVGLDHPGIVPVHDVGSTEDCPCYVVSKYIEGTDLSAKLKESRLKYRDSAGLVATVRSFDAHDADFFLELLADLFDLPHAQKVLAAFGRAFGTLPDNIGETTKEQREFLKQSVAGLAEEGKVICVRLALFAEMMKGKAWTPATLKEVGGMKGIGVTFLQEMFSSHAAHPKHRLHQKSKDQQRQTTGC